MLKNGPFLLPKSSDGSSLMAKIICSKPRALCDPLVRVNTCSLSNLKLSTVLSNIFSCWLFVLAGFNYIGTVQGESVFAGEINFDKCAIFLVCFFVCFDVSDSPFLDFLYVFVAPIHSSQPVHVFLSSCRAVWMTHPTPPPPRQTSRL